MLMKENSLQQQAWEMKKGFLKNILNMFVEFFLYYPPLRTVLFIMVFIRPIAKAIERLLFL